MKKLITAGAALVLALALASPTAALADEVTEPVSAPLTSDQDVSGVPVPEAPAEAVSEAQVPAPQPVAEPVPAPAPVQAPAPAPEAAPAPEVSTLSNGGGGGNDNICRYSGDGWQEKVETPGWNSRYKEVSAPDGFLIAGYCVKASSWYRTITVNPPQKTVVIDSGSKHAISHYQIRLVAEPEPLPEAVPVQPTAQAGVESCVNGQSVDANGTITLSAFEGGHWAEAEPGVLTNVTPGEHGFTPVIHEGYTYDGPEKLYVTVPASLDVECDEPVVNACVPTEGTHSTNLADLWHPVDIRSKGHVEYVEGGLHVWTDDASSQAKVSEGFSAVGFPLHDVGVIDLEWEGTTPPPGVNLYVNFGSDGVGILVYESVYGQDLWLTNGSSAALKANAPVIGGGNGSPWHGTIDQWLSKYPDAMLTGVAYSLGSGVHGDGIIRSITVGCATHTFDLEREVPEQPDALLVPGEWSEPVVNCTTKVGDELTVTREVTTTPYVFDEEAWEWVLDTANAEVVTENDTVVVEAGMLEGLECPTPTPTPTPTTSTPAPSETPTPTALAVTGGGISPIIGFGALALVLIGGLGMTVAARRR